MRAGASEFLYPPLEGQLAEALSRAAAECEREGTRRLPGGRIVAFLSAKGGCGATTLACHVAGYLHKKFKKRVLLADIDFVSGNAGLLMGTDQRYNIMDALDHLNRLDLTLWKSLAASTAEGPDFIAAPLEPVELAGRVESLTALMRFWRSQYDYTIADLGHGLTPATCALLNTFDSLTLVTTAEMPALRLAKQIIGTIGRSGIGPMDGPLNAGASRLRLVVNRMPRRAPIQLPELERIMGFPIYSVVPNEYQLLQEAYAEPKLLDPDSTLGIPIAALAAKISGAPQGPKKARRLGLFS
jgi:pilus assembly protein CpaE